MIITLDNVSNLLHLPIDQFYTYVIIDTDGATKVLVNTLFVDYDTVVPKAKQCRGGHVCLIWLREVYENTSSNRQ